MDSGGAAAVEAYRQLKRDRAEAYYFDELELNALGRELLFKLNRVHDATAVLTLNVEEHPDSYNVCDTMGYVLRKEGRTAEALDLYRKGIAAFRAHPDANEPYRADFERAVKLVAEAEAQPGGQVP